MLNCAITVCYGDIELPNEIEHDGIIRENNSSVTGGHKGAAKTYERIRERYYWPNMRDKVRDFVRNCEKCKLNKVVRVNTKLPMAITDTPTEVFEKVEMDIVGSLPQTEHGNKYILTLQDNLTKYSIAIPLKRTDSMTIARSLAENFIATFGCPKVIHTDQGSDFISKLMLTFCKLLKIRQLRSTAFHPQSLGSLERNHHVLIQYLKIYCQKTNWDRWVPFAMFSYNTSKYESTGYTPFQLIFGKMRVYPRNSKKKNYP